jgi:aromatic-L-amino-acid/L-tryptophan decarboxylase
VADLITNAVNRYISVWSLAPGLVQLEWNVVRWFCGLVGFPAAAGGILTSGGSLANLVAVVTARRERLPEDFLAGMIYTSSQTHHSVQKAAMLAGFPLRNVRQIATDAHWRLDPGALAAQVAQDRAAGLLPFLVVASAGTTNTGAIDDLGALADIAVREELWLHVDAAYGGFFVLTAAGQALLRDLSRADSITLDPHKGLFLPYGTGALLVRDRASLRRAHSVQADYMPAMQEDADHIDFCESSPELSRGMRGLRIWLPLKLHGAGVFRECLEEKLALARWAAAELAASPGLEVVTQPQLSIVTFRLARPDLALAEQNVLNQRLLGRINARQRIYLTPTMLGEMLVIRMCILSFRTHRDRVEQGLADIRDAVREIS